MKEALQHFIQGCADVRRLFENNRSICYLEEYVLTTPKRDITYSEIKGNYSVTIKNISQETMGEFLGGIEDIESAFIRNFHLDETRIRRSVRTYIVGNLTLNICPQYICIYYQDTKIYMRRPA